MPDCDAVKTAGDVAEPASRTAVLRAAPGGRSVNCVDNDMPYTRKGFIFHNIHGFLFSGDDYFLVFMYGEVSTFIGSL
jgi:hypothetical protein